VQHLFTSECKNLDTVCWSGKQVLIDFSVKTTPESVGNPIRTLFKLECWRILFTVKQLSAERSGHVASADGRSTERGKKGMVKCVLSNS
jgi:hypothetical protein